MTPTDGQPGIAEVRKQLSVPQAPDQAFTLFVEGLAEWWPLATHSVGQADATTVVMGRGPGAEIVESLSDGRRAVWGTVSAWNPPYRLTFSWHPGEDADRATEVDVSFTPDSAGTTVTLVHTGWARRSDGREARDTYQGGWSFVLGHYCAMVGGSEVLG